MSNRRLRLFVLRWHRRVGVAIALIVVLLVITGVALNHSDDFGLDEKYLSAGWAHYWYGIEAPPAQSFRAGAAWLSLVGGETLYLDDVAVAWCDAPLRGAVAMPGLLVALCNQQLLSLTSGGELLERIAMPSGVQGVLQELGLSNRQLVLRSSEADYLFDPDTYVVDTPDLREGIAWSVPGSPPQALAQALKREGAAGTITLERFFLDLHSGRLPGRAGVWLMDIAALLLLLIALGGCWVWATKPGRWH